jgi:hypothetical protein
MSKDMKVLKTVDITGLTDEELVVVGGAGDSLAVPMPKHT